eukprot:CAMPEP_0195527284 /NCGR_PEP_ID=MMETSP0794_2-20130614/28844_1 /TAXON_ID=515487 /ORGANISM="Stephanopyxis turris, Strain CCMP 815" /LENGTH=375 /DNA_ID=CAMNT_0040658165 /DNA_START=84 /DNA_END=1212 /DNA_ORIENTATION=+
MDGALGGIDIQSILGEAGPVVKCVILRAIPPSSASSAKKDETITTDDVKEESKEPDGSVTTVTNNSEPRPSADLDADSNDMDKKKDASSPVDGNNTFAGTNYDQYEHLVEEVSVDTTPKKCMVREILGGPVTFLGQYEEEGIVVISRRISDYEENVKEEDKIRQINPHRLQPPLHNVGMDQEIRGDLLLMRVKKVENEEGEGENDKEKKREFFLDYTKDEYATFAARTDIVPEDSVEDDTQQSDEEEEEVSEDEDESDEEDEDEDEDEDYVLGEDGDEEYEESPVGMMNMLMGHMIRKFNEQNGRGPSTEELLAMRSALATRLGIELDEIPTEPEKQEAGDVCAGEKRKDLEGGEDDENKKKKRRSVQFSSDVED